MEGGEEKIRTFFCDEPDVKQIRGEAKLFRMVSGRLRPVEFGQTGQSSLANDMSAQCIPSLDPRWQVRSWAPCHSVGLGGCMQPRHPRLHGCHHYSKKRVLCIAVGTKDWRIRLGNKIFKNKKRLKTFDVSMWSQILIHKFEAFPKIVDVESRTGLEEHRKEGEKNTHARC